MLVLSKFPILRSEYGAASLLPYDFLVVAKNSLLLIH